MTTLFPSLKLAEAGNLDAAFREPSNKSKSKLGSAFFPTATQIYTTKFIHFPSRSIFNTKRSYDTVTAPHVEESNLAPRPIEILSYHAVQVTDLQQTQQIQSQQPNLGVWNSYLPNTKDTNIILASSTLNGVLFSDTIHKIPTFLFTIDLADPSTVYETVSAYIQTVLKLYEKRQESSSSSASDAVSGNRMNAISTSDTRYHPSLRTTAISTMASIVFGQASSSSSSSLLPTNNAAFSTNLIDSEYMIRLVLCAIIPHHVSTTKQSYRDKQAQRFVQYHLHRYAHAVNCTLLFVQDTTKDSVRMSSPLIMMASASLSSKGIPTDTSSITSLSSNQQSMMGLTVHEVTLILKKIVDFEDEDVVTTIPQSNSIEATLKLATTEEELETENVIPTNTSPPTLWLRQLDLIDNIESKESSSLFLPDSHNVDLIESVLVRNASCSGLWDAYKDPLWIALKFPTTNNSDTKHDIPKEKVLLGEQEWLQKLSEILITRASYSSQTGGDTKSLFSDTSSLSGPIIERDSSPNRKKTENNENNNANSKSGDGVDVASFFDDLLK